MPLQMIFRSVREHIKRIRHKIIEFFLKGALIANMILGVIILKKKYNLREYLSIVMITVGIFICTYFSSDQVVKQTSLTDSQTKQNDLSEHFWWLVGKFSIFRSFRRSFLNIHECLQKTVVTLSSSSSKKCSSKDQILNV